MHVPRPTTECAMRFGFSVPRAPIALIVARTSRLTNGGGIGDAGVGVVRSASDNHANRGNEWCFFVQYVLGRVLCWSLVATC